MKRNIALGVLIISIGILFLLVRSSYMGERYEDLLISDEEYRSIVSSHVEKDGLVSKICFSGNRLIYDRGDEIYYYSLIEGDKNANNPLVQIDSDNNKLKVAVVKSRIDDDLIKNNGTVRMLVYDEKYYHEYGLKCTTLPILEIECPEEIGDYDSRVDLTLFDNSNKAFSRYIESEALMHIRGDSTRYLLKKGYRIKLVTESLGNHTRSNNISLLGMRKDDDWLLYAAFNDHEKIRNVFSTNLWADTVLTDNEYDIQTGMRYKYVESFVNGKYHGIYALGYPVDEKVTEYNGDITKNAIYKKRYWDSEDRITYPGGYALKSSVYEDIPEEILNDKNYGLLYRYYFELAAHAKDSEYLYKGIDLDNAMDFMLFMNLIQGWDNINDSDIRNMFIALEDEGDHIKGLYIPWDMDMTWGNKFTGDLDANNVMPYYISPDRNFIQENGYANQIIVNGDTEFLDGLIDKYWKLRSDEWSNENILSMIDDYEEQLFDSGAFLREMDRWPTGSYSDPDKGFDTFRDYVLARLSETDAYYDRLSELKDESIYIVRSAQYKDFLDKDFEFEINDRSILQNQNYLDLFEYMGINPDSITEDVRYIHCNPGQGRYEYIAAEREEYAGSNLFTFISNDETVVMNMDTDYVCSPILYNYKNLEYYVDAMRQVDKTVFIRFGDVSFVNGSSAEETMTKLGVDGVTASTDAIMYNFCTDEGIILDDFECSGNSIETDFGTLTYFETPEGAFGYYLNGSTLTDGEKQLADYYIDCVVMD